MLYEPGARVLGILGLIPNLPPTRTSANTAGSPAKSWVCAKAREMMVTV